MLPPPAPVVVVRADYGGNVATFSARISAYLKRNVTVRIKGDCMSSCTMLAALPPERLCVEASARFGFHQAFYYSGHGRTDPSLRAEDATAELMRHYPAPLQDWIDAKGGLTKDLVFLQGDEMRSIFRPCDAAAPEALPAPVAGGGRLEHSSR